MMMGMRSGFKKAAKTVTGQNNTPQKKNKVLDWALTIVTILLAIFVVYRLFLQ